MALLLGSVVSFAIGRAVGSLPLAVLAGTAAIALVDLVPAGREVRPAAPDADVLAGARALADRVLADWTRTGMVTPTAARDLLRRAVDQLVLLLDVRTSAWRMPAATGPTGIAADRLIVRRLAILGWLAAECRTVAEQRQAGAPRAAVEGFDPPPRWVAPGPGLPAHLVRQVDEVDEELERAAATVAAFGELHRWPPGEGRVS